MVPLIERLTPGVLSPLYINTCRYFLIAGEEETPGSQWIGQFCFASDRKRTFVTRESSHCRWQINMPKVCSVNIFILKTYYSSVRAPEESKERQGSPGHLCALFRGAGMTGLPTGSGLCDTETRGWSFQG